MNIVTCLAIDINDLDRHVKYKALGRLDRKAKQTIYWRLAYTYFITSLKINPNFNHILYTNDEQPPVEFRFDYWTELLKIGVDIRYLPLENYNIPVGRSTFFKNAYYKFELFRELGKESDPSLYTDLDCIWVNEWDSLKELIEENELLLYDVYNRNSEPLVKHPNNISMKDMGDLFKKFSSDYPIDFPIWYGGEFIGAKPKEFREISKELKSAFKKAISEKHKNLRFPNGETLLDGDEYLSSYVYNKRAWKIYKVNNQIKRVWTLYNYNNVSTEDFKLKIWHLPAEKISGFQLFFNELRKSHSKFRSLKTSQVSEFVCFYFGLCRKKSLIRIKSIIYYFMNKIKLKFHHIVKR